MEGGWFPAVDSWETYVSFTCDFGHLMDRTFLRSWLREEHSMVCCSNLTILGNLWLSSSSAIINDLTTLCEAGSASMAYFYFDFRDVGKQARRNLLPSLLVQLSNCSNALCDILSRLYKPHDNVTRQPSSKALIWCLKKMITLPN